MKLQFLGANQQVTGSRYLLETAGRRIMIDCGLFQERAFESRNWDPSPVDPKSIDCLVLTHGHLDHVGLVPRLVKQGFNGPIVTTKPSVELASIIMLDSARIQQEDVKWKKKRHLKAKRKSPNPYEPLYTVEDAQDAIKLLKGVDYGTPVPIVDGVTATFHEAGHILGSAMVEFAITEDGDTKRIVFSGDVGQWNKPLIGDPTLLKHADAVILESTYGDRNHPEFKDIESQLEVVINRTINRGGNVVIPTFAVERAQELMYHIGRLVNEDRIPDIPIFLDSPMAVDVTETFRRFRDWLDDETQALFDAGQPPLRYAGLTLSRSVEQSKAINALKTPHVVMSASGMCTAGRIKHHLKYNIERPESTLLFVGYQATGTLGRLIVDGLKRVRIHGEWKYVRAEIDRLEGMSAHGDRDDLLRWLGAFEPTPAHVFLTHGEFSSAVSLSEAIHVNFGVDARIPSYQQVFDLSDLDGDVTAED